jgi:ribonuclease R
MIFQKSLNSLLSEVVEEEQNLVDTLTIRTMSKAKYSTTDNIGITDWHLIIILIYITYSSYPDVMVHRLLQYYLDGGNQQMKKSEAKCLHSSTMEGLATSAERIPSNTCR